MSGPIWIGEELVLAIHDRQLAAGTLDEKA
jgi:hypothetical protein